MRFLIGLIFGTTIAMSMASPSETLGRVMDTASTFFKQLHLPENLDLVAKPGQMKPAKEPHEKVITQPETKPQDDTESLITQTSPAERSTGAVGTSDMRSTLLPLSLVQAAWSPFYSQASATGFAARLEHHMEKEFRVVKNGPANYEVVFDYTDETERKAVLESIQAITGYHPKPPSGSI
jgi:hypothetical protein